MRTAAPTSGGMPARRAVLLLAAVFLLAFGARLAYLEAATGSLVTRDSSYEDLALSLRDGLGYSTQKPGGLPGGFAEDLTRPPGYPAFLAAVDHDRQHVRRTALAQVTVSAAFAAVLALLVAILFGSVVAGAAAGALYALDWVSIVHTPVVISEAVYPIVFGAGLLAAALAVRGPPRARSFIVAGLLLGCSTLVKPAAQVVIVGVAAAMLVMVRPRRLALVFLASAALVALPWAIRNRAEHGVLTLAPVAEANLYFYSGLGTLEYQSLLHTDLDALERRVDVEDVRWTERRLSAAARQRELRASGWRLVRDHFARAVAQAGQGLARTMFGTGRETAIESFPRGSPPPGVLTGPFALLQGLALWLVAVAGLLICWRRGGAERRIGVLLAVGIALALLPSAAPNGYSRFRTHAVPAMAALGAIALASSATRLCQTRTTRPSIAAR